MFVRFLCRTYCNLTSQRIFVLFFADFLRGTDLIIKKTMASGGKTFTLKYQLGDLFDCPETDSLAHCVSKDLKMGKGIAVAFKEKFGKVDYLKSQGKKVGEVAYLIKDGRYIYYLITKEKANDKPTYEDFKKSLQHLKKHCVFAKVAHLSMPRLGCGLDKLEWSKVEQIISDTFGDMNIAITVYDLPPKETDVKQSEKSNHSRDEKASPKGDEMVSSKQKVTPKKADVKQSEKSNHSRDEKASPKGDEMVSSKQKVTPKKADVKQSEKSNHSRDEKASPKGDEMVSSKVVKDFTTDEKAPQTEEEKTSIRTDEKPFLKRDEQVPSKDKKSAFETDEKATSKEDAKPSSKRDENAPSKGGDKNTSKKR
ncbi:hypothetical protein CHS0354_039566 [Potamilus streckersoni]|uniref:Macro domain-containing protein n=1 Tax=Potamilus streckersoni TaxID=2493646 RepID=A0AAE0SVU6_9BIVA|nr:hypothetical protein CHS0354_039566 [Potamilus streckersoni]